MLIVPPGSGIVHQVNLEYLARVVFENDASDGSKILYPDSVVGTDSHTTMINGLGVLGWGVGGIEAEAVMLGQSISMLLPEVIGYKLEGKLSPLATSTDLVLTITKHLRQLGVVGKFVEFYGPGVAELSIADRATISNMCPEYGATVGYFPIDENTLGYMKKTSMWRQLKFTKCLFNNCSIALLQIVLRRRSTSLGSISRLLSNCATTRMSLKIQGSLRLVIFKFIMSFNINFQTSFAEHHFGSGNRSYFCFGT